MNLAIISDEISLDLREAVEYGLEWGIEHFELRDLTTGRVPYIKPSELSHIIDIKEMYGINISAISPGLFDISLQDEEQLKLELEERIYDSFRFAEKLGTRDVVVSSFRRYEKEPSTNFVQIVHILGRMASVAEKYGFRLMVENDVNYWCDTGENTARVLEEINSMSLRANWDPANAYAAGEIPYPYGYLAIRKYISNIHVKDARMSNSHVEWVAIGHGEIDWSGQFNALLHGVNLNYITIETHCQPLIECSYRNVRRINNIFQEYVLNDSYMIR